MSISKNNFTVQEDQSAIIRFTLRDEDGVPVPKDQMVSMALTLYDRVTGEIINDRDHQNALDANGVTMATTEGVVTWNVTALDTVMVNDRLEQEVHVALFQFGWGGGTKKFAHEIVLLVYNMVAVP